MLLKPQQIPRLAIIPAKQHSERCPDKNIRPLAGLPLFLHSVHYALQEGFTPLVSTDSEQIITLCRQEKIPYHREKVDDSKMENCVNQILETYSCDLLAVLQPTSPLRPPGLLRRMAEQLEKEKHPSSYTAQKIKLIGHLDGRFQHAHREQTAKHFLHFFDGSILLITPSRYRKMGAFFADASRPYLNTTPCSLQIDTEQEFKTLSTLASSAEFAGFIPSRPGKKRICIISNKKNLKRDYSAFVDSCDKIIRISKMENLDSGLAGRKTDMALVSCFPGYLSYSREEQHIDTLKKTPEIYFNNEEPGWASEFTCRENITHWKFLPTPVHRGTANFTTLSKALCLADTLYPEAQLYYLGDTDAAVRAPASKKHPHARENAYLQNLIDNNRLIPILEDNAGTSLYSSPAPGAGQNATAAEPAQNSNENHKNKTAAPPAAPSQKQPPEHLIHIRHPQWNDKLRLSGNRAVRLNRPDQAAILLNSGYRLSLRWDKWGTEEFFKTGDNQFRHIDYRPSGSVNQTSKYATTLIINPCDGRNSVFRHTAHPFIALGYTQWDYLLLLNRMRQDILANLSNMPQLKTVLFTGICKDSLSSLRLALNLAQDRPDLKIGVLGCSWASDFSGPSPDYQGRIISQAHARLTGVEPYKSLFAQHGDALAMLESAAAEGRRVHIFGFYACNTTCTIEKETTLRLEKYTAKNYACHADEKETFDNMHGKILHLAKHTPALIHAMMDDAMNITATTPPDACLPEQLLQESPPLPGEINPE